MPFTEVIYLPLTLVAFLLSIIESERKWYLLIIQHFAVLNLSVNLACLYDSMCSTERKLKL